MLVQCAPVGSTDGISSVSVLLKAIWLNDISLSGCCSIIHHLARMVYCWRSWSLLNALDTKSHGQIWTCFTVRYLCPGNCMSLRTRTCDPYSSHGCHWQGCFTWCADQRRTCTSESSQGRDINTRGKEALWATSAHSFIFVITGVNIVWILKFVFVFCRLKQSYSTRQEL